MSILRLPDDVRRLFEAAVQRQTAGDDQGAIELYSRIVDLHPMIPDAYNNIAILLKKQRRLAAAIACLERAVLYAPQSGPLYANLGNMRWMDLRFEAAMAAFRRSIELDPNRPETFHNLGLLHFSLGDYRKAVECYDRSLAGQPGNTLVLWDRALALLASGDLRRGFAEYDIRFEINDPSVSFDSNLRGVRALPLPLWQGENLAGRSIYVYCEQGLGDTLQFVRFLKPLARQGARIIFDCQPELLRLLANFPGIAELRPQFSPMPRADFHCPLMSLPSRLGLTLETVPGEAPYLVLPPVVVGPVLRRPPGTRLAIGLVWAGRPQHNNDHNRSMPLDALLALCDLPGVALYSLQMGPRAADIAQLGARALVQDLAPQIQDFADTARLLLQLDLVISIDSAVVHLAGALARPAFLLLPFTPDWRWLGKRADTPWYPSLRLLRQERPGDWAGVVQQLRGAIAGRAERPA